MEEIWKPVHGWPYDVSNTGKVRNQRTGKTLATPLHKSGYLNVQLWSGGKFKTFLVHRLVAASFIGEQPTDHHEVAHNDGDRTNNKPGNLRWVLHVENMRDRDRHGTTARGSRNGKLRHTDAKVQQVRDLQATGIGSRRISKMLGMSRATVHGYMKNQRRQTTEYRGQAT